MPELVIAGESFACRDELPPWALMKLAKAGSGSDEGAVVGLFDLVMTALLPEERERFDAYMLDNAIPFEALGAGVDALMKGYTDRPTERPSLSPAGPQTTGPTSRVVSLSRGTVRVEETSPKDGAQAVS